MVIRNHKKVHAGEEILIDYGDEYTYAWKTGDKGEETGTKDAKAALAERVDGGGTRARGRTDGALTTQDGRTVATRGRYGRTTNERGC